MTTTTMHPVLRDLVSQFCALECCPSGIREALSSFLMTGSAQDLYNFRLSWRRDSDGVNMYWTDVLDYVSYFSALAGNTILTEYAAERTAFAPLRRLLKRIPKLHAKLHAKLP